MKGKFIKIWEMLFISLLSFIIINISIIVIIIVIIIITIILLLNKVH